MSSIPHNLILKEGPCFEQFAKIIQLLYHSLSIGVEFYDAAGRLKTFNDSFERIYEVSDNSSLVGSSIEQNPIYAECAQQLSFDNEFSTDEFMCDFSKTDFYHSSFKGIKYVRARVLKSRNDDGSNGGYLILSEDITASTLNEKQLLLTKRNLELAMFAGNVSAWSYCPSKQIFRNIFGCSFAESGLTMADLLRKLHPDDHTAFLEMLMNTLSDSPTRRGIKIRVFDPKINDYVFFESKMMADRDSSGENCVIGTQRDVTQIERFNRSLRRLNRQRELAIKSADLVYWDFDCRKGLFTAYNEPLNDFDSLRLLTVDEYMAAIHPDDKAAFADYISSMKLRGEVPDHVDLRLRTKLSPDWQYVTLTGIPIEYDRMGLAVKYTGFRRNNTKWIKLTEQIRAANEKNDLVLNNTTSAYAYITDDYVVQWENASSPRHNGVFPPYKVGEKCYKSAFGYDEPCENCIFKRSKASHKTESKEVVFGDYNLEIAGTPVFADGEDVPRGCVHRIDNITEKCNTIKMLNEAKDNAEQSDRLKSAFLANMSHEIRTPLNAIVGFSNLITSAQTVDEKESYKRIIENNTELLLTLIGDILDLSKIESGIIDINISQVDLTALVSDIYSSFAPRVTGGNLEFISDTPYKNCYINVDKERLTQVITNFLTNARKFTFTGHIKIGYSVVEGGVKVYVADTGIGIAKENIDKVFLRFEKLNDFAQGSGLGMAICKAIADVMGGKIGIDSELGKGSTFWAFVPTAVSVVDFDSHEKQERTRQLMAKERRKLQNEAKSSGLSILVAEDNDSNFLLINHLLKGHKIERACNGFEAVELMHTNRLDIVFMDIKMPLMGGLEATCAIREFDNHTPIYALTANAYESDKKEALDSGCNGFVPKPINPTQLFDILSQFTAQKV